MDAHRRAAHRPAGLGHRPLQLPLPVLHAGGGAALARARRDPLASRRSSALVRLLVGLGIEDVRLTGGEPLARRDFPTLVGDAGRDRGRRATSSLTTNGYLLERDADGAGRRRDRPGQRLDRLAGARPLLPDHPPRRAAAGAARARRRSRRFPQVRPIKVNAVAMRDFTEDEVVPLLRVRPLDRLPGPLHRVHAARRRPRLDAGRGAHRRRDPRRSSRPATRWRRCRASRSATARVYRFADGGGEIGFINPVSEPFCADCNRLRLTADGKLRTCLFSIHETDLREPLRAGASDEELDRDRPRRGLAQGAEAPRRTSPASAAAADDERDRRLRRRLAPMLHCLGNA